MRGIVWIASYPKSGNTWFRVFLSNLLHADEPVSLNDCTDIPIASSRQIFEDATGIEASDLMPYEINRLRPLVYRHIASEKETTYLKVHDAYLLMDDEIPMFPIEATSKAIYIVRNPLDVAVSYADHCGLDYDTAIIEMANENNGFCLSSDKLESQLPQKLLSWSSHVRTWTTAKIPVHILKYEEMKNNPVQTFCNAVNFLELNFDRPEIERALKYSAFELLRRQEEESGYKERSPYSKRFFRKGEVDSYKTKLNDRQIDRLLDDHGEMMNALGYLDIRKTGEIV
jgi:hypothetical protein